MSWWRAGLPALVLLAACNTAVTVEGSYACDPGQTCPTGFHCEDAVCKLGVPPCTCGAAPAPRCTGAVLSHFVGRCVYQLCQFDPVDEVCPSGCAAGACLVPTCTEHACAAPPPASCLTGSTLRTYAMAGSCVANACVYTPTDVSCPGACAAGACTGADLCQGVSCDAPPPAYCLGTTARRFGSPGTCAKGTGSCGYAAIDTVCPAACSGGACVSPSVSFTQVGPAVRFAINALDVSPAGDTALAVGNGGRVASWTSAGWSELPTPSAADLRAVSFVSPRQAWLVGAGGTLWSWRSGAGLSAVPLGVTPELISVHGLSESAVLTTSASGAWAALEGSSWAHGVLPSAQGPYALRSAYVDEQGQLRLAGLCGAGASAEGCVATRAADAGWRIDVAPNDHVGFTAMGGGFLPAGAASLALLGRGDGTLATHDLDGGRFAELGTPPEGTSVLALSTGGGVPRTAWVLTASPSKLGALNELEADGGASVVLETFTGEAALSRTVAQGAAPGVLLAEVNRVTQANTILRHSALGDEPLDVGLDFVAASLDPDGTLYASNAHGDVALWRSGGAVELHRADGLVVRALEAANGPEVLLAGQDTVNAEGAIFRWLSFGPRKLLGVANVTFTSLCRASVTEGWAVGTQGTLASIDGLTFTQLGSGTTKDLLALDCAPGTAVACGADSTVLRLRSGSWSPVTPAFPLPGKALKACRVLGTALYVAGDGFFYRFDQGIWTALPPLNGLSALLARSPTELYAASVITPASATTPGASSIRRFDGTQWSPAILQVSGVLAGGVQTGSRVVFAGAGGVLVKGQ